MSPESVRSGAAEKAPAPFYRETPLAQCTRLTMPSGDEAVAVSGHADVRVVMADTRFKTDLSYPGAPRALPGENIRDNPDDMLNMDPPRHTQVRRSVSREFTPRRIAAWRPRITAVAESLLDEVVKRGSPADIVTDFALPYPIQVLCELLGIPHGDWPRFHKWSDAWLATTEMSPQDKGAAMMEFRTYIEEFAEERRRNPGDALIDKLVTACDQDNTITQKELVMVVLGITIAGHDNIASFLPKGLLLLLTHRSQYEHLVADPGLIPQAVEEILRYDVQTENGLLRVASEDVVLPSGNVVREGEAVLPIICAANRDGAVFAEPDRFDVTRSENPHVGFGHGRHLCLGSHLARLQLQIALELITQRMPDLQLAIGPDEIEWKRRLVTGIRHLPVTW
jgi:cytochrome P450